MKEDVSLPGGIGGNPSISDSGCWEKCLGAIFPLICGGDVYQLAGTWGKADSERQTVTDGACKLNERIARPDYLSLERLLKRFGYCVTALWISAAMA